MDRVRIKPEIEAMIDNGTWPIVVPQTGPKTEIGKSVTRLNAVRHGLDSNEIILKELGETPEQWDKHLAEVVEHFNPIDGYEHQVVEEIAEVRWLIRRVRAYRRNTTRQAHDAASRCAMRELSRGELDARPEYWEERAYLPDSRALEKADRHHGRLLRKLSILMGQLRQSRQDRRIDIAVNIGLAILHKWPDIQNEIPHLDIIDVQQDRGEE